MRAGGCAAFSAPPASGRSLLIAWRPAVCGCVRLCLRRRWRFRRNRVPRSSRSHGMSTLILITIIVFVVVAGAAFSIGSLFDQRSARARLLRDRLSAVQKAAEREPSEELALLRDEMLSEIPALDNLLRRSERISNFQTLLSQAGIEMRA